MVDNNDNNSNIPYGFDDGGLRRNGYPREFYISSKKPKPNVLKLPPWSKYYDPTKPGNDSRN